MWQHWYMVTQSSSSARVVGGFTLLMGEVDPGEMLYACLSCERQCGTGAQADFCSGPVCFIPEVASVPYPLKPQDSYTTLGGGPSHLWSILPRYYKLS